MKRYNEFILENKSRYITIEKGVLDVSALSLSEFPKKFLPLDKLDIEYLNCCYNKFVKLPSLPETLKALSCDHNELISLPELPPSIVKLVCSFNKITSIPELPEDLEQFTCSYNELTSLPELPKNIRYINCNNNKLKYLPELPEGLLLLNCDNNDELDDLQNIPDSLETISSDKLFTGMPIRLIEKWLRCFDVSGLTGIFGDKEKIKDYFRRRLDIHPEEIVDVPEDYKNLVPEHFGSDYGFFDSEKTI
jgi:hypothetical protein